MGRGGVDDTSRHRSGRCSRVIARVGPKGDQTNDVRGNEVMAHGKVDTRVIRKSRLKRLRFYDVHEDQRELILDALKKARNEAETEHDTVALTGICLHYLANSG